jgi:hypothetical protein
VSTCLIAFVLNGHKVIEMALWNFTEECLSTLWLSERQSETDWSGASPTANANASPSVLGGQCWRSELHFEIGSDDLKPVGKFGSLTMSDSNE